MRGLQEQSEICVWISVARWELRKIPLSPDVVANGVTYAHSADLVIGAASLPNTWAKTVCRFRTKPWMFCPTFLA